MPEAIARGNQKTATMATTRAYAVLVSGLAPGDATAETRDTGSGESLTTTVATTGQPMTCGISLDAPATMTAAASKAAGNDAMYQDEVGRMHVFSRLVMMLSLIALGLSPLLGGDPVARTVFFGAIIVSIVGYGGLAWITRTPEGFRAPTGGLLFQLQGLGGHGVAYFFGIFSPFPAIGAIALYVFALGQSVRHALIAYANMALGQALLAALIISGAIEDRGLVHAEYLSSSQQITLELCVQMVYLVAFLLGRMGRARTVAAVSDFEHAVREIARREALLHEANLALHRAEQGGPGQYTDHIVGSFKLGPIIGRGAMGEVYEGENVVTGQSAAVKLLRNSAAQRGRFAREAKVAASLSAPNLVRVLEIAEQDALVPYLAMERLLGHDLGHILRERSPLSIDEIVDMVRQVSNGLEVARSAGIVHRDLKPQNIFLAEHESGRATWKVLDFGVSKLSHDESSLTHGHLVGTPAYMAPEQATGGSVDHRADVYSLAIIAYRCLTGRPAFSGAQIPQVLYQVVHEMPLRPSQLAPLPADIDAVLAIGMAKRPKNRFASARDFAHALATATSGELAEDIRRRAAAIQRRHPWSTTRC